MIRNSFQVEETAWSKRHEIFCFYQYYAVAQQKVIIGKMHRDIDGKNHITKWHQ